MQEEKTKTKELQIVEVHLLQPSCYLELLTETAKEWHY